MATLKVLELAVAEIGYLEKASAKDLDSKTGNAGDKNYTKYARDLDAVSYFNGKKQGQKWCATLVCWLFFKGHGKETALKMLYQPAKNNLAASCKYAIQYYKAAGRWYTKNPQPGDQSFFQQGHTGIVERVEGGKIYTIEGNTSGASGVVPNGGGVCRKSYSLSDPDILGYGRPDYSLVQGEAAEAVEWITKAGIMRGNAAGDLMLDQPVTRRQFAVMLRRYDKQRK